MKIVYCISGLGFDEKAFSRIKIPDYEVRHIAWLIPYKNESIEAYSKRMSEKIEDKNPVLIGLSFGGMICIEIAKFLPVKKIILISSVKNVAEIPKWMRTAGKIKLNKILPIGSFKILEPLQNKRLGVKSHADKLMVRQYRNKTSHVYLDWSIHQILNWKNVWSPGNIYHIHGEEDKIFPIKTVQPTHIIKKGTHFMIMDRAEEINECINEMLKVS